MLDLEALRERIEKNTGRVRGLIELYQGMGRGQGRRPVNAGDVLRAATVLLHATLEDFLRAVEADRLPSATQEVLGKIPLAGATGRSDRFNLGDLVKHKTLSVADVIACSVKEHLAKQTYNNPDEVVSAIQRCGLDARPVRPYLPAIGELIARRHDIVHRADRHEMKGSGHHAARSIGRGPIDKWLQAVKDFTGEVLKQLSSS